MTKCEFYIHQLNTHTKKILTQRARFVCIACHLIFKGAISMMNESFYCMTSKSTHICMFISVCYVHTCTVYTFKSFAFFSKILIVISNFTWFAANFDSQTEKKFQKRKDTPNKCNDKVFRLHSWSQKSALHTHIHTNRK